MNEIEELSQQEPPQTRKSCILATLSRIYREAGMPGEAAMLSAIADYECGFAGEICCET